MTRELRIKTLLTAFVLSLFLFVSFFSSAGAVLCFGKDGHVAIEFSDVCNGAGPGSQLAGTESDASGPCKDVRFLSGPAQTTNASHYTQPLSLNSSSPVAPSLPPEEYSNKPLLLTVSSHHTTIAGLHSVVLLI